eukprot:4227314-Prymnesium_polylepis.1
MHKAVPSSAGSPNTNSVPILEVRQVRVSDRTRPELHNGGGLGINTPPSSSDSKDKMRRPTSAGSALGRPFMVASTTTTGRGAGPGRGRCGDVRGRASRSREQPSMSIQSLTSRSGQLPDVLAIGHKLA